MWNLVPLFQLLLSIFCCLKCSDLYDLFIHSPLDGHLVYYRKYLSSSNWILLGHFVEGGRLLDVLVRYSLLWTKIQEPQFKWREVHFSSQFQKFQSIASWTQGRFIIIERSGREKFLYSCPLWSREQGRIQRGRGRELNTGPKIKPPRHI